MAITSAGTPSFLLAGAAMAHKTQWYLEALEFFRSIVPLPTLVSVFAAFYTENKLKLAVATGIALVIALGLRLFGRLRPKEIGSKVDMHHILLITLPWLLTATLVFLLVF